MTDQYNFDVNLSTERYTIEIATSDSYGYFQNNQTGTEGGLWFEGKTLIDYDGVYELPAEVEQALKAKGYSLDDDEIEEEKPSKRPITDYGWRVVDTVEGNEIGYRAITDRNGRTICNPSPMGEGISRLIATAPALLELLVRGFDCGIFDDAPEYKEDAKNVLCMAVGFIKAPA